MIRAGSALLLVACVEAPREVTVEPVSGGIDVRVDAPVDLVTVLDADGLPLVRRRLPNASEDVWVELPWQPRTAYTVRVEGRTGTAETVFETPDPGPVSVAVEAPLGQDVRPVSDGDRLDLALVDGASVQIGVVVTAYEPGPVQVEVGSRATTLDLRVSGERRVVVERLDAPVDIRVTAGDETIAFSLVPTPLSRELAAERLRIAAVIFPADPLGRADAGQPAGRISLPARWWEALLRRTRIGFRPADSQAPWGLEAVVVSNDGPDPVNVVVGSRVLDGAGGSAHAFRPRLREADGAVGEVTALLRVPAHGRATAVLPLFVDRDEVGEGEWTREVVLTPLGATEPLERKRVPLYVSRGSGWVSAGFAASLLAAVSGVSLLLTRIRGWLSTWSTADLTTIALFGSLQFVLGLAAQLVATVSGALLGPFSPLLTGLVDDTFRAVLLATLLTLLPRPGTVSLSLTVGYLLRVMALGSFTPVDAIWLGASITWLEGALWLTGLTRSGAWRDESAGWRWLRLSGALGTASVLSAASAIAVHVVLYRLFYADWYVWMVLAGPSFLYVLVACGIAVPFAASLRRVAS